MSKPALSFLLFAAISAPLSAQSTEGKHRTVSSAQVTTPPSPEKLVLIRRFMKAAGIQDRLDSGSFLERYALNPDIRWTGSSNKPVSLFDRLSGPIEALKSVYEKYRAEYQAEFEGHINWEFSDQELAEMIAFFEAPVGQHYLDGTWRMYAYTNTNLEELEGQLVEEAVRKYNTAE